MRWSRWYSTRVTLAVYLFYALALATLIWMFGFGLVVRSALVAYITAPVVAIAAASFVYRFVPPLRCVLLTVATTAAWVWVLLLAGWAWYVQVAVLIVVLLPLNALAKANRKADLRAGLMAHRNDVADRIVGRARDAVATGARFCLYLRPFDSTNRVPAQATGPGGRDIAVYMDVETLLAEALRRKYPLVAVGDPGDIRLGAGRAPAAESTWQATVTRLIHDAELVIVLPWAAEGTLWEMRWLLRSRQLGKVVFVMPQTSGSTPSGVTQLVYQDNGPFGMMASTYDLTDHTLDYAAGWAEVAGLARSFGLHLPPYAAAGALFTLDPAGGGVAGIVPLALAMMARPEAYIRAALGELGFPVGRTRNPVDIVEAFDASIMPQRGSRTYAFSLAADAYAAWGDMDRSAELSRRSQRSG